MFSYMSYPQIPLPAVSLMLPLAAAGLLLLFYIYKKMACWLKKSDVDCRINIRALKAFFLLLLSLNLFITWSIWAKMGKKGTELYVLSGGGWSQTLSADSPTLIKAVLQVDAFGAMSAFLMAAVALIAGLAAMADKDDPLSPSKAGFFLATLAGIQGIFYSGGIFSLFAFISLSQVGASGLYHGIIRSGEEFKKLIWYHISRVVALLMFLVGSMLLYYSYRTTNIAILSTIIKLGTREKFAYALLVSPLLFMFIKSSSYVTDGARRVFFAIRAQAALFVVFRIIFSLYGANQGLEKISDLFIVLGFAALLFSLILTAGERDPIKFAETVELFMKGFLLVSMGVSISGSYGAQQAAEYGFGAIESMMALWILFLPASAALSFVCCTLKRPAGGAELWQRGGLYREMPFSALTFFFAVCVIAGLPPFIGFPAKQFLFRTSSYITPLLTILLLVFSLLMLLISLRYISAIMFRRAADNGGYAGSHDTRIIFPLLVLFVFLFFSTVTPNLFINSMVSPSVYSLLNKGQLINAIHQGGGAE